MSRLELADSWSCELPPDWLAERDGDTVALTHPDAAGTAHLTELRAPRPLDQEQLRALASGRHGSDPQGLEAESRGEFTGLGRRELREQNHVYELYLAKGRDLLFVTYVCDAGEEEVDREALDSILNSLGGGRPPA